MQSLAVTLTVPIPEDSILIKKVELEELKKAELKGVYWNMKDLEERTKKGQAWLKENLLYVPKFKRELDSLRGGCVFYPQARGQNWSFHAVRMAEFLDDNFHKIFK